MLYLLTEYGAERMNELFSTFKEGSSVEDALDKVYGLSRDELDNEWRASVGLGPREQEEDRSTTIEDEVIAGPEVAEDEQTTSDDAEQQAGQQAGQSSTEQAEPEQEAAQQAAQASEGDDEPEQSATTRTDEEIAERTAEIQRRQDQRRSGPIFEAPAPFPWEYPLIGIAGALVLLNGLLLVRVLTPRRS